jgi:hypothetical protein
VVGQASSVEGVRKGQRPSDRERAIFSNRALSTFVVADRDDDVAAFVGTHQP